MQQKDQPTNQTYVFPESLSQINVEPLSPVFESNQMADIPSDLPTSAAISNVRNNNQTKSTKNYFQEALNENLGTISTAQNNLELPCQAYPNQGPISMVSKIPSQPYQGPISRAPTLGLPCQAYPNQGPISMMATTLSQPYLNANQGPISRDPNLELSRQAYPNQGPISEMATTLSQSYLNTNQGPISRDPNLELSRQAYPNQGPISEMATTLSQSYLNTNQGPISRDPNLELSRQAYPNQGPISEMATTLSQSYLNTNQGPISRDLNLELSYQPYPNQGPILKMATTLSQPYLNTNQGPISIYPRGSGSSGPVYLELNHGSISTPRSIGNSPDDTFLENQARSDPQSGVPVPTVPNIKKKGAAGPKNKDRVKRPMNAFMVRNFSFRSLRK